MDSTASSERRRQARAAGRSALEGASAALALGLAAAWLLDDASRRAAVAGLFWAWGASSLSVAALVAGRARSFKAFMWAFGGGVALRAAVLAGLMIWTWGRPYEVQAGTLAAYALGCLVLLLVEYRNLAFISKKT